MSKVINVNSSLAYEILLYLNSFYLGMFIVCETAMGILKVINVTYPEDTLATEAGIFCALCFIETLRIFLGRRGNLASNKIAVLFSVLLTIPSAVAVCYFLICQTYILRLEYIWCLVMLMFHALELAFAILYIFTEAVPINGLQPLVHPIHIVNDIKNNDYIIRALFEAVNN